MLHLVLNTCSVQVNAEHVVFLRGDLMSTNNRSQSLFLVSLMILASWVPLATADEGDSEQDSTMNTGLFYTLDEFDPTTNGKPYGC